MSLVGCASWCRLVEVGSPHALLADEGSAFSALLRSTNEEVQDELQGVARANHQRRQSMPYGQTSTL